MCEEVSLKLRRLHKKAQTVGLALRGAQTYHARKTVTEYLDKGADVFRVCNYFLNTWDISNVRMISVWTAGLQNGEYTPLSLFDKPQRKNELQKTIDAINEKFGDHTIRNGFLLYADKLTTVPNGFMADKYERTKLAEETSYP